jgi:hypothetical protein
MLINFKLDNESFPLILNMKEDICLGKIDKIDTLISHMIDTSQQNQATWYCEKRQFKITPDGFLQFRVSSLGIYAVIVNPNPDVV